MSERVQFFSPSDMSSYHNLKIAARVIESFSEEKVFADINDVIELFHIRRFIDNDMALTEWSEDFVRRTDSFKMIVARCFRSIQPNGLVEIYNSVAFEYKETFWEIIDAFDINEILEIDNLTKVCSADKYTLRYILRCSKIVRHHSKTIAMLLKMHDDAAEWLLDHYVAEPDRNSSKPIFIPLALTTDDKEEIIDKYLDRGKEVNLNYVRLVNDAKDDRNSLVLSTKTRLKAKRLEHELTQFYFKQRAGIPVQTTVRMSREAGIKTVEYNLNGGIGFECTYDANLIDTLSYQEIIFYFEKVFLFLNPLGFINLISMRSQEGVMERRLGVAGRNTYRDNIDFKLKDSFAVSQMLAIERTLNDKGRRVEEAIKLFYEDYLKAEYCYPSQRITIPSAESSYVEKIRAFAPEMDAIVKQYNLYTKEGEIDPDLLALESSIKITDSASCMTQKYFVVNDKSADLNAVFNLLFGDQSLLGFVDPYKDENYPSLFSLLKAAKPIDCSKYAVWQMDRLNYLIEKKLIGIGESSLLKVLDWPKIIVLYHLYKYKACSLWHYSACAQKSIKEMTDAGWISSCNKLLTPEEENYFSFILNNERFTNAYAIRNHYAHGSNAPEDDEIKHEVAYARLLIMFVLLLLKIDDDLSINAALKQASSNHSKCEETC